MNFSPLLFFTALLVAQGSNAASIVFAVQTGTAGLENSQNAAPSAERLIAAHAEALRHYRNDSVDEYHRIRKAIDILKKAGVPQALTGKPPGITDKKLAEILNDYGFFLAKASSHEEAINVYNRVIQLDPTRAVAYLNLADSLRARLGSVATYQDKVLLTKQVKSAYLQFKQLGGKATNEVNSFLSLNVIDKPITDFCQYVAAYTNQGRLREIFGTGESVVTEDGKRRMRVFVRSDGTAHMVSMDAVDPKSGEGRSAEIYEIDKILDDNKELMLGDLSIVPFSDGHHVLFHWDDKYLTRTVPIGYASRSGKTCMFNTRVVSSLRPISGRAEFCKRVEAGTIQYIDNKVEHSLSPGAFETTAYMPHQALKALKADFDNDGHEDVLLKLDAYEPGGRPCQYTFFDLLNSTRDGFERSYRGILLKKMQRNNAWLCKGSTARWLHYSGITYLELKYPGEFPKYEREHVHRVVYLKNDRINIVCDAAFHTQTIVQQ